MTEYLIYFNQQWWATTARSGFDAGRRHGGRERDQGRWRVRVRRGLEEEDGPVYSADATSGTLTFTDGPFVETKEFLGGLTVVDVADAEAAKVWAARSRKHAAGPRRYVDLAAAQNPMMRS
jgi:hypothetical protein